MRVALIVFGILAAVSLGNYVWYRVEETKPDNAANLGSLIPGLLSLGFGMLAGIALLVLLIKWIAS